MAAVMTTARPRFGMGTDPTIRPRPTVSATTYRRRRVAAVVLALAIVVVAAQAGGALGDSPLAVSERRPASHLSNDRSSNSGSPTEYVVKPGESLWSIAEELAPGRDPRPVVDALSEARDAVPLIPGETIVLPASLNR